IPVPQTVTLTSTPGLGGIFYPRTWTIRAAAGLYAKARHEIDAAWMRSKAADLYHEARHAEQYFMAAKLATAKQGPLTTSEAAFQELVEPRTWEFARAAAKSAPVAEEARGVVRRWIEDSRRVDDVVRERDSARADLIALGTDIAHDLSALPPAFFSEDEC